MQYVFLIRSRAGCKKYVSRCWCTGVVLMRPGVKVNGAYYCDALVLKQLLPDNSSAGCKKYVTRLRLVTYFLQPALERIQKHVLHG